MPLLSTLFDSFFGDKGAPAPEQAEQVQQPGLLPQPAEQQVAPQQPLLQSVPQQEDLELPEQEETETPAIVQADFGKLAYRKALPEYKQVLTQDKLSELGITSKLQQAHFVAQMMHESGGLAKPFEEAPKGATRSYFDKYDGRKNLGNTQKGDGYKYRGRGLIHLTGRANYEYYGKKLGLDLINNPDLAMDPDNALKIGVQFWHDRKLNEVADQDDIEAITKAINGGYNGLSDRKIWLRRTKKLMGG